MKKIYTLVILFAVFSLSSFAQMIVGPAGVCTGSSTMLSDSMRLGGTWTSSDAAIATIGSTSGIVSGIAAGTVTISYLSGSGLSTTIFTVTPAPASITGTLSICAGATTTLSNATPGGTWSVGSSFYATISSGGVVTGIYSGMTSVYYSMGPGCHAMDTLAVTAGPRVDSVFGPSTVCIGTTGTMSCATTGGVWSSSAPSVAAVDATTGITTGISAGFATITYAVTGTCGTGYEYHYITVTGTTSPGTISGTASINEGATTALHSSVGGGTWSSSTTTVATVDPATGVVTGVSAGTTTITYSVSGCSGTAYTTMVITVSAFDGISGHVYLTHGFHSAIKVWLIRFNTSTLNLYAADSTIVYASDSSVYYEFAGVSTTDSFRVKAAVLDTFHSSTGYIPTYHTSSYYWNDATVFYHTAGTGSVNKNIYLDYGTVTTGPGFIAGDVTTGANKGTAGDLPAVGMLVYVMNSGTGQLMQSTYTNAAGHYSFSNLPVGITYHIYPEAINYTTTAYTSINLTSSAPSMPAASFIQHLLSKTITPVVVSLNPISAAVATITTLPNPTNGKLSINWQVPATELATITIIDVAGRQIYTSKAILTSGAGTSNIDISSFANGTYIFSIRAASVSYIGKVQVQH